MLKNELDFHMDDEEFWTDSKAVLGYINSDVCWFEIFVANRFQQIGYHISPKLWHYVESSTNPLGDASRVLDPKKKDQIKRWFDSPSFLRSRKKYWLGKVLLEQVSDENPEVRKVVKVNVNGANHGNKRSAVKQNWQSIIFEPAKR